MPSEAMVDSLTVRMHTASAFLFFCLSMFSMQVDVCACARVYERMNAYMQASAACIAGCERKKGESNEAIVNARFMERDWERQHKAGTGALPASTLIITERSREQVLLVSCPATYVDMQNGNECCIGAKQEHSSQQHYQQYPWHR